MDRDRQHDLALNSTDALLDRAARAAISHAQKHRTGLRGWKPSQLVWEVQEQLWDPNLACSVVLIAAQPLGQPEAPQAVWEYWLDDRGKIMPGFPTVKNLPDWGAPGASESGRRIDGPRPTKRDARILMGAIAVAGMIILGSLGWVAVDTSTDDDANAPVPDIFPTPAPFVSPTPMPAPEVTLAPTFTPVALRQVVVVTSIPSSPTPAPASPVTASNISFSQETGTNGESITIAGSGFPSFSPLESITIGGVPAPTKRATTDASGNIVTEFIVPQTAPAGVHILEITIGGVTRGTRFEITGPSPTPTLAPTPVPAPASNFSGSIFFEDDFEGGATGDWSNGTTNIAHTDNFTEFLGNFGNDTVSLTLIGLPTHSEVELRFDLYLLDSWDGDATAFGPDSFRVGYGNSLVNLLDETFGLSQSYRATRPDIPCRELGFNSVFNSNFCDTIYKNLNNGFSFPHTRDSLTLNFSAIGLQALIDESWGIDNVRVALILDQAFSPTPTPIPTSTLTPELYFETGLLEILALIPSYTGNIGQLCVELRQLINTVNLSGAPMSIDIWVNRLAGEYWSQSSNAYSVRIFQGLPPPGQIIPAQQSDLCQS